MGTQSLNLGVRTELNPRACYTGTWQHRPRGRLNSRFNRTATSDPDSDRLEPLLLEGKEATLSLTATSAGSTRAAGRPGAPTQASASAPERKKLVMGKKSSRRRTSSKVSHSQETHLSGSMLRTASRSSAVTDAVMKMVT